VEREKKRREPPICNNRESSPAWPRALRRGGGTRWPLVCMIGGWVVPMGPLGRGGGYRADAGSWKGAWANPPGTAFAEETSTWLATYILYGGKGCLFRLFSDEA